jgi:hypothetical protein
MNSHNLKKSTVRTRVKKLNSRNLTSVKQSLPVIKKQIQDSRIQQSKMISQIKDNVKKIRESNISIVGIDELSTKSIIKLQKKRAKSLSELVSTVNKLNSLVKDISKLERKYKQNLK